MTIPSHRSAALEFIVEVEGFYASLMANAAPEPGAESSAEPSLGGKLLYAGPLDEKARALVIAANIAGAASLAATDDAGAQKQAARDGVVDFLVNSLDEALRILKNQLRKRETVSVCIAAASALVEREMRERGVLPDLLPQGFAATPQGAGFLRLGARPFVSSEEQKGRETEKILVWSVASAPAVWLPKVDALAAACLAPEAELARRWLRLAPRYLGRLAHGVRLLRCAATTAECLQQRLRESVARGEIGVAVELQSFSLPADSIRDQSSFTP